MGIYAQIKETVICAYEKEMRFTKVARNELDSGPINRQYIANHCALALNFLRQHALTVFQIAITQPAGPVDKPIIRLNSSRMVCGYRPGSSICLSSISAASIPASRTDDRVEVNWGTAPLLSK